MLSMIPMSINQYGPKLLSNIESSNAWLQRDKPSNNTKQVKPSINMIPKFIARTQFINAAHKLLALKNS